MATKNRKKENKIVVYQGKNGAIELNRDFKAETIWASESQIADIFEIDRSVVGKHIRNIFKNKELDLKSNGQKMPIPNSDKPVTVYTLDLILAVGYRTNSGKATEFRKWATKTLRQYIIEGYAINKSRITSNYMKFLEAVEDVKQLLPAGVNIDTDNVLDLVKMFADTWLSLLAYDKDEMVTHGVTQKNVALTGEKLNTALQKLRSDLLAKGEATDIFGIPRQKNSIAGIVGNVMQSFGGKDLYPTVEEKAAHLLYFIIKNHPLVDGNKRSGAYSFVWFLRLAGTLDTTRITPPALTALTILVAESDSKQKDKMIGLILTLLGGAK